MPEDTPMQISGPSPSSDSSHESRIRDEITRVLSTAMQAWLHHPDGNADIQILLYAATQEYGTQNRRAAESAQRIAHWTGQSVYVQSTNYTEPPNNTEATPLNDTDDNEASSMCSLG